MGLVLDMANFRRDGVDPDAERKAAPSGECEVVIFPGIRIERHDVNLAARQRDVLGVAASGDTDSGRRG
ncbi:MAG: hypothetical protein AAGF59_07515 [Pseudomonadota bacterium]